MRSLTMVMEARLPHPLSEFLCRLVAGRHSRRSYILTPTPSSRFHLVSMYKTNTQLFASHLMQQQHETCKDPDSLRSS
ncbi:hypothetical protein CEXT_671171 [Caerostris extrusa]|uniref:Uncharacterized protein n=1 Tax=Caerostris extrusa TaxID=172846 RepID=A0AAV4NA05_CAEEX|nr:hypothetical protein CEXT_671171 [Caerostris extrusa]